MSCDWQVIVPEEGINLILNPSFEEDLAGWVTGGTNTITRSDEQSFLGDYSAKVVVQDSVQLASFAVNITAVTHTFSMRIYVPSSWDGGGVGLTVANFTGVVIDVISLAVEERDRWVELFVVFTPAADTSGIIRVLTASAPTPGSFIYVDAGQLEAKAYPTTYIDGDQEDCSWDGVAHASTSRRLARSRAGGRVRDLEDDFAFRVQAAPGAGFAPVENIIEEHVTLPGGTFQRARLGSRMFVLSGTIIGDITEGLSQKREELIRVLSPFAYDKKPVTFRYSGGDTIKHIRAQYAGGLETGDVIWRNERVNLPFVAIEPQFFSLGENSEPIQIGTITTRLILGYIDGEWSNLGPPDAAGIYTNIRDIKVGPDRKVYVCGDFLNFDSIAAADYIARYDPVTDTWEALGTPNIGASLNSILKMVFAGNKDLYVVGDFVDLAGIDGANYIARWDGSNWSAVGSPSTGATITDIRAIDYGYRGRIWVGGNFTNLAGIAAADYIAYYDIAANTWNAAGEAGANAAVDDIWARKNIDQVYATGAFTAIGSALTANRIAIRNTDGIWENMGTGLDSSGKRLLHTPQRVYVAGEFTNAGPISSQGVAYWLTNHKWQPLGGGVDAAAYALAQKPTGEIIVGGTFDKLWVDSEQDLDIPAESVGYWNGSAWQAPEFNLPGVNVAVVYAVATSPKGDMYFGYDQSGDTVVPLVTTITNNGTAPAWPVFVINMAGGASSPLLSIENVTTGKRITFSYTLEPDRPVWIDLRPKTLGMYHSPPKAGPGTDRFFQFGADSDLADFDLAPGENNINLSVELKVGGVLTATVRWVDSWEGIDG